MNKVTNQYRYTVTDQLGAFLGVPLGEGDFTIAYEQEKDSEYFYAKTFNGKITFVGDTFRRLHKIEQTTYLCGLQRMQVFRSCNGVEKEIFNGVFRLTEGEWNLDKCSVTLKFEKQKSNECITKNKTTKVDLLAEITSRVTVGGNTAGGVVEYKECSATGSTAQSSGGNYWCGDGEPSSGNWTLIKYSASSPDGNRHFVQNKWARELVTIEAGDTPEDGWIQIKDKTYAKKVSLIKCVASNEPDGEDGSYNYSYNCDVAGYTEATKSMDNGMGLADVFEAFKKNFCPSLTVVSDFFQINAENKSPINYVTKATSEVNNLVLFQKSDVKRPNASANATKAQWTFEKLMETLNMMFNVYYFVENGILRIEHVSWFTRSKGLDLTLEKYSRYTRGKRAYSYDIEDIPSQEIWQFKEQSLTTDTVTLDYSGGCVSTAKDSITNYNVDDLMTDVTYAQDNSASDSNKVEDTGFVLVATRKASGGYFIISKSRINDTLFFPSLLPKYGYYNRPLNVANYNGSEVVFNSTKPFKKGEKISVPLPCSQDFNPNDIIKTNLGNGIIDKAEFDLKSGMLSLDLKYNVFDNLGKNSSPKIVGNNDLKTTKNTPITIAVNATDVDGEVIRLELYNTVANGSVEILDNKTVVFTPAKDYTGWTYFHLVAVDNWGEKSSPTGFVITIN